jgi:hypothetical protein
MTRVGLQKSWGGSIVEVSLNGTDYVNNDDPGRQIPTSLWDANANYSTSWGYSPVEAGDHFFDGSPLLTSLCSLIPFIPGPCPSSGHPKSLTADRGIPCWVMLTSRNGFRSCLATTAY